jgi:hypothetical protein
MIGANSPLHRGRSSVLCGGPGVSCRQNRLSCRSIEMRWPAKSARLFHPNTALREALAAERFVGPLMAECVLIGLIRHYRESRTRSALGIYRPDCPADARSCLCPAMKRSHGGWCPCLSGDFVPQPAPHALPMDALARTAGGTRACDTWCPARRSCVTLENLCQQSDSADIQVPYSRYVGPPGPEVRTASRDSISGRFGGHAAVAVAVRAAERHRSRQSRIREWLAVPTEGMDRRPESRQPFWCVRRHGGGPLVPTSAACRSPDRSVSPNRGEVLTPDARGGEAAR